MGGASQLPVLDARDAEWLSVPRNAISGNRGLEASGGCHDLQSVPLEALMEYENAGVHSTMHVAYLIDDPCSVNELCTTQSR